MKVEDALIELEKYAKDFENIEDPKKISKDEFLHKYIKVYQYFSYIIQKAEKGSWCWLESFGVVTDIAYNNPKLRSWIDDMIIKFTGISLADLDEDVTEEKDQKDVSKEKKQKYDTEAIKSQIYFYSNKLKNMRSIDPNEIESIERQLSQYRTLIDSIESEFEPNEYEQLMYTINSSLSYINDVLVTINSTNDMISRI